MQQKVCSIPPKSLHTQYSRKSAETDMRQLPLSGIAPPQSFGSRKAPLLQKVGQPPRIPPAAFSSKRYVAENNNAADNTKLRRCVFHSSIYIGTCIDTVPMPMPTCITDALANNPASKVQRKAKPANRSYPCKDKTNTALPTQGRLKHLSSAKTSSTQVFLKSWQIDPTCYGFVPYNPATSLY